MLGDDHQHPNIPSTPALRQTAAAHENWPSVSVTTPSPGSAATTSDTSDTSNTVQLLILRHLSQAKVDELQRPVRGEGDVVRLKISMADNASRYRNVVEVLKGVAQGQRQVENLAADIHPATFVLIAQALSLAVIRMTDNTSSQCHAPRHIAEKRRCGS